MRGILFVVGVAACAKVPPSFNAEPSRRVETTTVNGAHRVEFGDSRMDFAPDSRIELPETLSIAGHASVLGDNTLCGHEERVGVTTFPLVIASATTDIAGTTSTSSPEINTAALAKLRVDYSVPYNCNGPRTLAGHSIFTFYPGDRVYREDIDVSATNSDATFGGNCTACGAGQLIFTSFWTFNRPPMLTGMEYCIETADDTIGLAWRERGGTARTNAGAAVYDWANGPTLTNTVRSAVSVLVLAPETGRCSEVVAATNDPTLLVGDEPVGISDDGTYDLNIGAGTFTLTADGPMTHGFAILLRVPDPQHVRITRSDGKEIKRLVATHDDKSIIWIDEGFDVNESLTVEVD